MADFNDPVSNAVNAIFQNIASINYGMLLPEGKELFLLLSVIVFSWMGIRYMLQSGSMTDLMGSFIQSVLMIGLVYWFIQPESYKLIFGTGNINDIESGIVGTMNKIALMIGEEAGLKDPSPAASITSTVSLLIEKSVEIAIALKNEFFKEGSFWTTLIASFFKNLFVIIYYVAAMVLLLLAGLIFFAVAVYSQVMIIIALILGPVLIPWLLLQSTSFLFDGWLRFLIISALTKVVGAIMIAVSAKVLDAVVMNISGADFKTQIISAMMAMLFSLLIVYLMSQIPSIASSIIQGGSGANLMRGIASAGRAAGAGGRAIGDGLSKGGQAVSNASAGSSSNLVKGAGAVIGGTMKGAGATTRIASGGSVMQSPAKSTPAGPGGPKSTGGVKKSGTGE
jgi:type IV secretory pathway VirB6-like protein